MLKCKRCVKQYEKKRVKAEDFFFSFSSSGNSRCVHAGDRFYLNAYPASLFSLSYRCSASALYCHTDSIIPPGARYE